jgi:DNA-binding transcriptional MerR regulator
MQSSTAGKYHIGQMCESFGVTARALRFYEDEELISPERRGTARFYSDRDRARLTWILRGKRVGFSLGEIRDMLDLYDVGDQQKTQFRVTVERCKQRIEALRRQKDDIDATIVELQGFVAALDPDAQPTESQPTIPPRTVLQTTEPRSTD